jgi:hypothetical protein
MDPALLETLKHPLALQLISGILMLVPAWRIFRRAGQPPFMALLVLVPWAGLLLAVSALAFRPWPNVHPLPKKEKRA